MPYKNRTKQLEYFKRRERTLSVEQRAAEKERKHRSYLKHQDRIAERRRADYLANQDKYKAIERERKYLLLYGITTADYNSMLAAQGGKCAICRSDRAGKKGQAFAVDHCHDTSEVRGLLCVKCNVRLGWLRWYDDHRAVIERYLDISKRKAS